MAKKKNKSKTPSISISQEDMQQAQQLLGQYHQVAHTLHQSNEHEQAKAALSEIDSQPETTQIALLKALAKEQHSDAADVVSAMNELATLKNVRKEAKRTLLQLQGAKVYPHWQPPMPETVLSVLNASLSITRSFWKGQITDTLDVGEVQMILAWEQGPDNDELLVFGFLLDFMGSGVKDVFHHVQSKQAFARLAERMAQTYDMPIRECSLAEGRKRLRDALAVNNRYGTTPHREYRQNRALIEQLIINAPVDAFEDEYMDFEDDYDDDDDDDEIDLNQLDPMAVVINFIENWVNGDYDIAYRLLTSDSPLRQGLSNKEWAKHREAWADQGEPGELQPGLIQERESEKPKLWLPRRPVNNTKIIEAAWSIELNEEALVAAPSLPELPTVSSVYKETGRHWFWTAYTLVQEEGAWRIESMSDEVANLETFASKELELLARKSWEAVEKLQKKVPAKTLPEIMRPRFTGKGTEKEEQLAVDITIHLMRYSYYVDALIKKSSSDEKLYDEAAAAMLVIGRYERCLLYMDSLLQLSENHLPNLKVAVTVKRRLSEEYFAKGYEERGEHFSELARKDLDEVLAIEDSAATRISLAELYIDDEQFTEAEEHLLRASTMTSDAHDLAHIEMHLGQVANGQVRYEEALTHYQRAAELQPDVADTWADLAEAYEQRGNVQAADENYRRAMELDPENGELYVGLSSVYERQGQTDRAFEILEEGVSEIPNSLTLNTILATKHMLKNDFGQAERYVNNIARIDPAYELLPIMRASLDLEKTQAPKQAPRIVESKQNVPDAGPFRLSQPRNKKR